MIEDKFIQETAPLFEALPHPSNLLPHQKNHSVLPNLSQSLRAIKSNNFYNYYGIIDKKGMQSTSITDSKACKKRDPTCSIRHGFIAKKHLHKKQCNGTSSSNRATTQRILCPDAPRNTTSFLINDMEERLSRDVSPPTPSVSPNSRARCCSTSVSDPSTSECPIAKLLPHEDDNEQADDYYDMVDALSCERLSGLTRDEINRQLIHVEEHNKDLVFHFTRLREENDNLKQLLKANGIDPQAATASS
jgi:hypothetical protein